MQKKVIFIDWGGTLSGSLYWESWMNGTKEEKEMYEKINKYLFSKDSRKIEKWMLGKYSAEDICHEISRKFRIEYSLVFDELEESCKNLKLISDEIPILVEELKERGIKVVIATDNMDVFSRFTVPSLRLDVLFDDILNSYDIGLFKKNYKHGDIPFFREYLEKNNLEFSDCILIDDGGDKYGILKKVSMELRQVTKEEDLVYHLKDILRD